MHKYIEHLEKQNANLKQEVTQLRKLLANSHVSADQNLEDSISEPSNMTGMTGRPEIDAVSTISYDLKARCPPRNILDSDARGMEKFAQVKVPREHITSGRKNKANSDISHCPSVITNKLSESSRSHNTNTNHNPRYSHSGNSRGEAIR